MSKDERIMEMVLPEWDHEYHTDQECWERCPCGSSIMRVENYPIFEKKKEVGREYAVFCAKCGSHVFGFTDIWDEQVLEELKKFERRHAGKTPCEKK